MFSASDPTLNEAHMTFQHDLLAKATEEFPTASRSAYLDTACIGIASQSAARAVLGFVDQVQHRPSGSGTEHHGRLNDARDSARPRVAQLIGSAAGDIAIVENATHALNLAARALPLGPGSVVAMAETEYIQMGVTWSQLADQGVTIRRIRQPSGEITVDTLNRYLDKSISVLAISSVQWTSGFRADLDKISEMCRDRGVFLIVDAAQQIGCVPFDVTETPVDILFSSGHKWLNSPFGSSFLYLSPNIRPRLRRPQFGFFAALPPADTWGQAFLNPDISPFMEFTYTEEARAWETGGTSNYPGGIGLAAAVDLVLEQKPRAIWANVFALTEYLLEGLRRLAVRIVTPEAAQHRSGIITFTTGENQADMLLAHHLSGAGVSVSVRYAGGIGGIRVSCHWFNCHADLELLLDAVASFLRRPTLASGAVSETGAAPHPAADMQMAGTLRGARGGDVR